MARKLSSYKLYIFDWDGTIVDSITTITKLIQQAAIATGLPPLSYNRTKQVIGLSLDKATYELYPKASVKELQNLCHAYSKNFLESAQNSKNLNLFQEVVESIQFLKKQKKFISIATGKSRKGLNQIMKYSGIQDNFEFTITPNESKSKPNPKMLYETLNYFGLKSSEAVMIGDTSYDLEMANSCNMDSIAVCYGVHDYNTLIKSRPKQIFNKPKDFKQAINNSFTKSY